MNRSDTQLVARLIDKVACWAAGQPDILALALVGSWARGTATDASDIDLVLITNNPEPYLKKVNWAAQFGDIDKYRLENYGLVTSIRIWYGDGLEVEYGITDERWAADPLDEGTRKVIADGMRMLFDRGDILGCHLKSG